MSGTSVSQALEDRFDTIRREELVRLNRKLKGLSDDHRRSIETVVDDVVRAIARVPAKVLGDTTPATLQALVDLFRLDVDPRHSA